MMTSAPCLALNCNNGDGSIDGTDLLQISDLLKKHTIQGALDKLDVIECFETPGQQLLVSELLEKQKESNCALGIDPPTSL